MPTSIQIVKRFYKKVNKVVNANKGIELEIQPRDVTKALRKEHSSCVAAEAALRCFKVDGAIFSTRTAYLIHGDTATKYEVPESVAREIVSFDRGGPFEAGTYKLGKVRKHESRGAGTRHAGNPSAGKLKHHKTEGLRERLGSVGKGVNS